MNSISNYKMYSKERFEGDEVVPNEGYGVQELNIHLEFTEGNNVHDWTELKILFDALHLLTAKAQELKILK